MNALRALFIGAPITILAAIVVACGPGNNGPVAGVLTAPGPSSSLTAFNASGSVPLSANLGVPIPLPSGGGVGGTLTVPTGSTVPAGTVLSGTLSSSLPSGSPTLSSLARSSAAAARTAQGETSQVFGLLYGSLTLTNPVTIASGATWTFTFPAGFVAGIPSSFSVYMAMLDPTRPTLGWIDRIVSCTTSTSANSITCSLLATANIPANVTYVFALYAVASSAATPSPAPSVSIVPATPNPTQVTYTGGGTLALPSEGGVSGSASIPQTTGTSITGFGAATAAGAFLPNITGSDVNSVLYVGSLTPSTATTFSGTTTLAFTVKSPAAITTNAIYYLATYDSSQASSGWFLKVAGPGTVSLSAGTITFALPGATLKANTQYGFALYQSNTQPVASVTASTSIQSVALPPNSCGITGFVTLSGVTVGVGNVLNLTMGSAIASPIPTLTTGSGVNSVIGYGTIANTGTTNVTASGTTITLSFPNFSTINAGPYFLAYYDTSISPRTGWFLGAAGPATPNGNSITFSITSSATFQPSTKATYGITLYR